MPLDNDDDDDDELTINKTEGEKQGKQMNFKTPAQFNPVDSKFQDSKPTMSHQTSVIRIIYRNRNLPSSAVDFEVGTFYYFTTPSLI